MKRLLCFFLFFISMLSVLSVSAAQNVVSLHKRYELLTKASEGYPDDESDLTNGRYGTPVENGSGNVYYRDPEYVGFKLEDVNDDGNFVILLDLAESYTELADFEIGYLHEPEAGIFAPAKVAFYIADEKDGAYALVGQAEISPPSDGESVKAGIASVVAQEPASGRYVMYVITPAENASWTFLDEITVLQGQNPLRDNAETSSASQSSRSADPNAGTESVPPQAGDRNITILILLCAASALGAIALIGRRRQF